MSSEPVARQPRLIPCKCDGWHYVVPYAATVDVRCGLCERPATYLVLDVLDLCRVHFRVLVRELGRASK